MKSVYICLVVICAIGVVGCSKEEGTSLAEEGVTADAIAQYEADLAAVQGEDAYEEELAGDDDGAVVDDDAGE